MRQARSSMADIALFHGVTVDQIRSLKRAMQMTWDGIAPDYLAPFEGTDYVTHSFASEAHMVAEATIGDGFIHVYGDLHGEGISDWMNNPGLNTLELGRAVWNSLD